MRKSTDALKNANAEAVVFIAIGKIFWSELKVEKARRFFQRATELDPDNGDAWAHLIKFEESCEGGDELVERAKKDFLEAEPRHGTLWTQTAKKVENWRKTPLEILNKVKDFINT